MPSFDPDPKMKFTFGLWTVGKVGADPFGVAVREQRSPVELCNLLGEAGAYGVNFHDNDLVPITASASQRDQIVRAMQTVLYNIDPTKPDPGRVTIRRLNTTEYRNTIRDLTGVTFDPTIDFPQDVRTMFEDVYAELPWHLKEQQAEAVAELEAKKACPPAT